MLNEINSSRLVLSNGILWVYCVNADVHLFSLGDWLMSYHLPPELSMSRRPKIYDNGDNATLIYPQELKRTVTIEKNLLKDQSTFSDQYHFEPKFLNSLHFRKWKDLPSVETPIIVSENELEFTRKNYMNIKLLKEEGKFIVTCNIPLSRKINSYPYSFDIWLSSKPKVESLDKMIEQLYHNSLRSLYKLRMVTSEGLIKAAGFPNFPSLFGRDFSISALAEVYLDPYSVRNEAEVHLKHLGKKKNDINDETPGRAPHEITFDVESLSNQYSQFPNWFSNEASPLLLMTIFRLARIQHDYTLITKYPLEIRSLWEHTLSLDIDNDLFIEYKQKSGHFLIHQTWRDGGGDQIRYPDGSKVKQPIAPLHDQLCLVGAMKEILLYQKYTSQSLIAVKTDILAKKIQELKRSIEKHYWMPKLGAYALALDGDNEQVRVVNSDVCFGFYYRIFDELRAKRQYKAMIDSNRLLDTFGLRSVSKEHPVYRADSYQKGGVWPWQLSLTIAGVLRYELDAKPFIRCLQNVSRGNSLAEVYKADEKVPTPLTDCIEQRWSSALPWLALIEGIFGLNISYGDEKPNLGVLNPLEDFQSITIRKLPIKGTVFKINLDKQGTVKIKEE
ncbi:MAG: amylo-alpha-1,6-glucosidase [Promethearchaeota archaeon]